MWEVIAVTHSAPSHRVAGQRRLSWHRFVATWGWRAYAVPVLAVFTVVAVVQPVARGHAQADPSDTVPSAAIRTAPSAASVQPTPTRPASSPTLAPQPVSLVGEQVDSTVCMTNTNAKFVLVSISQQFAWMCAGPVQVYSSAVTTGEVVNGNATPTGSWVVQGKQTNTYLTGPGYRDFVHFWIPFDGNIGFHDATWQTMAFGSPGYRTQGSHGCVHLPMAAVTWLYAWVRIGSTVVTVTS